MGSGASRIQPAVEPTPLDRYTKAASIFAALENQVEGHFPVRLVRMSWLLQQKGKVLPRRQDLPEEAFLPPYLLRSVWENSNRGGKDGLLPIVSVSCCWDTPKHPDPTGTQLNMIIEALEGQKQQYAKACPAAQFGGFNGFEEMGIFWDWPSLLQGKADDVTIVAMEEGLTEQEAGKVASEDATNVAMEEGKSESAAVKAAAEVKLTREEKKAFDCALLETMDLWFAHQGTTVFLLTQHPRDRGSKREVGYDESGWTVFERSSTEQIKEPLCTEATWNKISDLGTGSAQVAARRWPVCPKGFEERLAPTAFSVAADRAMVKMLFHKLSEAQLGNVTKLNYNSMAPASTSEMAHLASCLLQCRSLKELCLASAGLSDPEIQALCLPFEKEASGSPPLPQLKEMNLMSNNITDAGAAAVARMLRAAPLLDELHIQKNNIGPTGKAALAAAWEPRNKYGLLSHAQQNDHPPTLEECQAAGEASARAGQSRLFSASRR